MTIIVALIHAFVESRKRLKPYKVIDSEGLQVLVIYFFLVRLFTCSQTTGQFFQRIISAFESISFFVGGPCSLSMQRHSTTTLTTPTCACPQCAARRNSQPASNIWTRYPIPRKDRCLVARSGVQSAQSQRLSTVRCLGSFCFVELTENWTRKYPRHIYLPLLSPRPHRRRAKIQGLSNHLILHPLRSVKMNIPSPNVNDPLQSTRTLHIEWI